MPSWAPNLTRNSKTLSRIARYDFLLGVLTDQIVAHLAGVTKAAVTFRRSKMGVKSQRNQQPSLLEGLDGLLGTQPDSEIAKLAGVTSGAVLNRRRRLGIEAFSRSKQRPSTVQTRK